MVEDEVDLAGVKTDAGYFHPHAVTQAVAVLDPLTHQLMLPRIEMKVIAPEIRDMHEPFDIHVVQRDEYAECRDAADAAVERFADLVLHVVALEPGGHIARR